MLTGGAGNDTLIGGAGDDTLDGGAGTDIADVRARIGAVTVKPCQPGGAQNTWAAGIDTLTGDRKASERLGVRTTC